MTNYKVYIRLDENNNIIDVVSTAFYEEDELVRKGYVLIDSGSENEFAQAQPFYLLSKLGKTTFDENFNPNFKYIDNQIVALSKAEKESLFPEAEEQKTKLEKDIEMIMSKMKKIDAIIEKFKL